MQIVGESWHGNGIRIHGCYGRKFKCVDRRLKSSLGISITLADGNETLVKGVDFGRLFC